MANIKQRLLASSILVAGLGLYLPLYKQIYKTSVRAFQEHFSPKLIEPRQIKKPCYGAIARGTSSQIGIAISPDRQKIYELTNNGIQVNNKETGERQNFELPYNFPPLSWGTDIAYDSRRDLISLVSFGGEGYFYRFDAKQNRWLDARSLNNIDLKSLTYDPTSDRYVAWAEDYGWNQGNLLFISGTGELLFQESVSDRMAGFHQLYDRGNEMPPTVEVFARGSSIYLMVHAQDSIRSIWHYDLDSNNVRLTYKSPQTSNLYAD